MRPNAEFHLRFALSPEFLFRRVSTAQMTFRAVLVEHLSYRRGKRAIQFRQTRANSYPHARFSVLPIRFALSPELLFRRASTAQVAFRAVLIEHLSYRRGKRAIQFRQTRAQILMHGRFADGEFCRTRAHGRARFQHVFSGSAYAPFHLTLHGDSPFFAFWRKRACFEAYAGDSPFDSAA